MQFLYNAIRKAEHAFASALNGLCAGLEAMKRALHKFMLPRIVSRSCESTIPRSGKKGEAVNCYVVAINRNGERFFIATSASDENLLGLQWTGESYAREIKIPISAIHDSDLNITHFYGLSEVTYDGIFDFAWHYFTRIVYLKIRAYRYLDTTYQHLFNKRKLVTKRRMELLRFMVDDQLDRTHSGI
jgi:hypothetical protein